MAGIDIVDLPDEEAVAHFRAKRNRDDWHWSFDWRDVSAEEHLTQFTFAKAARLDVLEAVRMEVDRAIAEGRTLAQFTNDLKPRLQKLGWWGEQEMVDPRTGEKRIVRVGPRRLRTIFDTNLRMAHAKGRWERIEALKEEMPYLRYVATLDARTRPDHRRWHGTVLPVDDPWWHSHYPPNGWRCRCTVQQLSERDLRRRGRKVTPRPRDGTRKWTNKRTGEILDVPRGIDPGFERNVGAIDRPRAAQAVLDGKTAAAPPAIQAAAQKLEAGDPAAAGIVGNTVRKSIPADPTKVPKKFRRSAIERLEGERDAGQVGAQTTPQPDPDPARFKLNQAAAASVAEASRLFPRTWVEKAGPLAVRATANTDTYRGAYYADKRIAVVENGSPDNAIHEYVHHLQATLPGFQSYFRAEHVRRTTLPDGSRKPVKQDDVLGFRYREGGYVEKYFGAHYDNVVAGAAADLPDAEGLEVPTRAFQILLHSLHGKEWLHRLAQHDPGMLDLALGVLFRFDP